MSHAFDFKYRLTVDIDKQLVFDGIDLRIKPSVFFSMDIKLVDQENKEILLNKDEKDNIMVVLSKIRSINGD